MKYSIQRFTTSLTIVNGQSTANVTGLNINGILKGMFISAPDMTQATFTLAVKDGASPGGTFFTTASLAKNGVRSVLVDANNMYLNIPLSGLTALTVTSAGAEGADRVFSVVLLVER